MARTKRIDSDLYTPLEMYAIGIHEFYKALRKAGFAVDLALGIISDRNAYPDWLLPSIPEIIDPEDLEDED